MNLSNCNPKDVFAYFEKICNIPRGSGNTKAISDYCVKFSKEHKLKCYQDELNNIIISKEASHGYEDADTIILQGHLDMVCEKEPEKSFDFKKDPIEPLINGDIITANGTTLGADNGIAIAMVLAVLADDSLKHPKIEALFTVDEETSMSGAFGLDCSKLTGHKLINLDSEYEGVLMCSCAGGLDAELSLPLTRENSEGSLITIEIGKLTGGHSGVEIDKGRANSNVLMIRLLNTLYKNIKFQLVDIDGGLKSNAIPTATKATILISPLDTELVKEIINKQVLVLKSEYSTTEPDMSISFTKDDNHNISALTIQDTGKLIATLLAIPNGVQEMSIDMPGLVQTSLNFGVLKSKDSSIETINSIRSSITTQKYMILDKLEAIVSLYGGTYKVNGDYPGWAFNPDSKLRETICNAYKSLTGNMLSVEAVHAGIECGLFADSIKNFDGVSLGPTMGNVHTPKEFLSISSVDRTYSLLKKVLEESN